MKTRIVVLIAIVTTALLVAACGSAATPAPTNTPKPTDPPTPAGDPTAGETAFMSTCTACHGQDAKGIAGLGKDLTNSEWVHSQTDEELIAFLKTGRPASDPLNTTGVDMPPKGGNPALTDNDLLNIVAYIRSLQQAAGR